MLGLLRSGGVTQRAVVNSSPGLRENVRKRAKVWESATRRIKAADVDALPRKDAQKKKENGSENFFRNNLICGTGTERE